MAAVVFMTWPGLDLMVASAFWLGGSHFSGQTALGNVLRQAFYAVPFIVFGIMLLLFLARRLGWPVPWSPRGAGLLFMAASLALGPGLLVNVILKDHSHRPRPYQVAELGGDEAFVPFYRFDGACRRNCSFVSGEGATAFWTLAPALLVPAPWRGLAVGGAILFGVMSSLLRIAFGGHFLSDSVFAALFTWLVILGCWRLFIRLTGSPPRDP